MCVAFSAMHSARRCGKRKFISAGHSVPGRHLEADADAVEGLLLAGVGDVDGGRDEADRADRGGLPRPAPICPRGPLSSAAPYMYIARRVMAPPA